jgi:hypothetical protein
MKSYEEKIAEAIRIEHDPNNGDLFIVFKVSSEKFKKHIRETWIDDIEYKLINKTLYNKE